MNRRFRFCYFGVPFRKQELSGFFNVPECSIGTDPPLDADKVALLASYEFLEMRKRI